MAATQAQPQQNDKDQPPLSANSNFQNGTDNGNNCRMVLGSDVPGGKGKKPSVDMSQYRQDSGPPVNNNEQNSNSSEDNSSGKINSADKPYSHNVEPSPGGGGELNFGKGPPPPDGSQPPMQGYGHPYGPQRGGYMHPDPQMQMSGGGPPPDAPLHHQTNSYGPPYGGGMRHPPYGPGPQQQPGAPNKPPPRPPGSGYGSQPPQQQPGPPPPQSQQQPQGPPPPQSRYMPGGGQPPPTGTTPTLNQLLQQSNSVHRYQQNSYGEYGGGMKGVPGPQDVQPPGPHGMAAYGQGWPPPRPMAPYPQQPPAPYRNQPPPPPGNRGYGGSPGGAYQPPPSASPSQQYPQQSYRHPYQMGTGLSNNGNISNSGGGDQRSGGPWSPGPPPQQPPQQHQQQSQPGGPPPQQTPPHQSPQHQPQPPPQQQQQPPPPPPPPGQHQSPHPQQQQQPQQPPPPPHSQHQPQVLQQQQQAIQHQQQQSQPPPPHPPHQIQQPPSPHQQHLNLGGNGPPSGPDNRGQPPRGGSDQSPTTHAPPDQGDLTGQNSNDSSSGGAPAPGTPNSQGMRPTPSPTGSSGSRSMSPAVGQQNITMPPRPSSGQSDTGNGPTSRMSHSPMANQGGYPGGGPHMHNYKMGPHQMPPHPPPPQSQQIPPYSPQPPPHQYPQQQGLVFSGNYVRGGLNYGAPGYQGPPGGMPGGPPPPQSQYAPRGPIPNHVQYPPSSYQHKVGYGSSMPPSPGSYNSHGGGTMGPPAPHHPGMPPPPPPHHDGAMPPPPPASTPTHDVHEPTITTSVSGSVMSSVTQSNVGASGPMSVTSIVTTGPDGTSLDEASQQSTLSNASAASGDDSTCTPGKSRKEDRGGMMGYPSHPTTPQSTAPSPGGASMNSMHEEYPPDHSPTWPRTPASPVFNSHVPQDLYRPKKQHDSLSKLYEMDETHDRKMWLDKLLHFMDERGTPITVCPTISKNPLDLFRLYLYVKERGGFMEVTKNKIWKDIAGLLGIGASSSAAYTLRKHYTKNLLPFECHFDRGGIDPQPIINQVEATSKKKGAKAAPVPSPGSSNSQDSFQGPGGMDGYGGYGYPPQEYNNQQRPPSQSNQGVPSQVAVDNISVSNPFEENPASTPRGPPMRPGMPPGGYQNQPPSAYQQYGDQYNQQYSGGSYPPSRPMYPPYGGPEQDRVYNQPNSGGNASGPPPGPGGGAPQGPSPVPQEYNRYMGPSGPNTSAPPPGPPTGAPGGYPTPPRGYPPPGPPPQGNNSPSGTPPAQQQPPQQSPAPPAPPQQPPYQPQQDYYRQDGGVYPGPGPVGYPPQPPGAPNKTMPPPAPQQPRRHPDFVKDQQPPYPPYNQQRPNMYPGWSNTNNAGGYRPPYPGGTSPAPPPGPPQQWSQGPPPRPGAPPNHQQANPPQWPPQPSPYQSPQAQQGWGMAAQGVNQNSPLRPPMGPRPAFRPDAKQQYNQMTPHPGLKGPGMAPYGTPGGSAQVKRELVFPPDSVEATTPVLYKRRRLTKNDVAPLEAWRIMMALKSGLLAETVWALDVLNILLFDDSSITYFGLLHLPGLMDILLEHMKKALSDMLEPTFSVSPFNENVKEVKPSDFGCVMNPPDPSDNVPVLRSSTSSEYTLRTRKGRQVTICADSSSDLFVLDSRRAWDNDDVDDEGEQDSSRTLDGPKKAKREPEVKVEEDVKPLVNHVDDQVKPAEKKPSERLTRKKGKSLSDVLSRIKKEAESETKEEPNPPAPVEQTAEPIPTPERSASPASQVKEEPQEEAEKQEEEEEAPKEIKPALSIKDPAGTLKRRRISDYEDECYTRDEASLYLVTETQDYVARRCVCLSTILRNLTFVPGNEIEFAKSPTFLGLVGKLLLLHHEHPPRTPKQSNYDRDEETELGDCCSSLQGDNEWWWEFLHHLRENALVSLANIAGYVDLSLYPEDVSRPILDGLLHWAVCPAAYGQDPFPTVSPTSSLSPQRLALEALCKLCVTDSNVDLVIATPPYCRLERLAAVLTRLLCKSEEQVLREFAVNLLYYLGGSDSGMARTIAMQSPCVSQLVAFIEQAEQSALGVANQHGLNALRDNPDCMGTSLDMLRRAARTLLHLSAHPDNWPLFLQQEQRLLALVMSQILDQQVASIISNVLFQVSRPQSVS